MYLNFLNSLSDRSKIPIIRRPIPETVKSNTIPLDWMRSPPTARPAGIAAKEPTESILNTRASNSVGTVA